MTQYVRQREQTPEHFVQTHPVTAYSQVSGVESNGQNTRPEGDVGHLQKGSDGATLLTTNLHTFPNRKPARLESADLNEIIEETKWLLPLYGRENIEVILSLTEDKLPVLVDRSLIKEVLVDLVANAAAIMPGGATLVLRTKRARFDNPESGECVHFSLSDKGKGMTKKAQTEAFYPSPAAKVSSMSVGAGLSRVYVIIKQQHNGNIRVDEGPGNGATVNLFLPLFTKSSRTTSVHPRSRS